MEGWEEEGERDPPVCCCRGSWEERWEVEEELALFSLKVRKETRERKENEIRVSHSGEIESVDERAQGRRKMSGRGRKREMKTLGRATLKGLK